MDVKPKHHTRRKRSHRKERGFERFLSSRLFIGLGIVFLLIGLYYSFASSEEGDGLYELFMKFLKPSESVRTAVTGGSGIELFFSYYFPAILALIVSSVYARKFRSVTYPASLLVAFYLIAIQIKIYGLGWTMYNYPDFFISSLFLVLPVALLFISALLHRKSILLILACVIFYITVLLFAAIYNTRYDYLFSLVLIFSVMIAYTGRKIEQPYVNLVNFVFVTGFFGLFWLRKFVTNSKPELLPEFFIFGFLFYILFYIIVIYASQSKEHPMRRWMQVVISFTNMLFLVCTTFFILTTYYSFGYLWIYVLSLLIFNVLSLYLLKRYNIPLYSLPNYFICAFLAALVLPLILHQNMALLFAAGLSVFMTIYDKYYKNRVALLISIAAMSGAIAAFLYVFVDAWLPAMLALSTIPDMALTWNGIISGTTMVVALTLTSWLCRDKYSYLAGAIMFFALFFVLTWIGFALVCHMTGTPVYSSLSLFVSGSLFFILFIYYYSGKQSDYKKPLLYSAFVFTFLYPLIGVEQLNTVSIVLHYMAFIMLIILATMTSNRIYKRNTKSSVIRHGVQIYAVIFSIYLLCSEYNNITLYTSGNEVAALNQYLPYSIIMWLFTLAIFTWSILKHNNFIRNISLVLFVVIMIKVFAYDLGTLSTGGRSILFLVMGVFLILFAILYPRFLKSKAQTNSHAE